MPNLTVSIPHQLSRAEAKRRIQDELGKLRHQQATLLGNLQESWTGDTMSFTIALLGQSISGHVAVKDQSVDIDVEFPWLVAQLAGALKQSIEQQGRRLLAGPKTP